MPDYARSDVEIAQKACVLAGMNVINDFSQEDLTEAVVLRTVYEDIVRDALTDGLYNFATAERDLPSRLATAPSLKFTAGYTIPQDGTILRVQTVMVNGTIANYDISEDTVCLDATETDTVTLSYIKRVAEQYWPPFFALLVIYKLTAILASSIARSATMAKAYTDLADRQSLMSRSRDSQQVTTQGLHLNRFKSLRRGG